MSLKSFKCLPLNDLSLQTAVRTLFDDEGFVCISNIDDRYSIVASNPSHTFSMAGGFVTIDGHTTIDSPIEALRRFAKNADSIETDPYLPFSGGIIGYIGFEAAKALKGFNPAEGFSRLPQARLGLYTNFIIFDKCENTAKVVGNLSGENSVYALKERVLGAPEYTAEVQSVSLDFKNTNRSSPNAKEFSKLAEAAFTWIRAENVDRIHLTRHIDIPQRNLAPYDFFLSSKGSRFLFSHEGASSVFGSEDLLLRITGNDVKSKLSANDFSVLDQHKDEMLRICSEDSLNIRSTKNERSFSGLKRDGSDPVEYLVGMLPATKFTGSPKHAAISYIDANETVHRKFYGGAFGIINSRGISFQTISDVTTFEDGTIKKTWGADLTADGDPGSILNLG